jgi:hypothetical protein
VVAQEAVAVSPRELCKDLCSSPTFWRYAALTLLLVNLHAVFRHLDATLPTYLVRLYGNGVPKGIIYSINPLMIIFLTPLVAGLTSKYNHFNMIKYGGYITAISPFFLVFSTSIWAVCVMVVFVSLGEAVWSPRVYDYVMSIAPEGREASFSALASAPLFAAKIPVGLMSGYLLAKYVPEDEDEKRQPKMLWLYIGLLTISSPILITIFDKWIREPEKPRHLGASAGAGAGAGASGGTVRPLRMKRHASDEMHSTNSSRGGGGDGDGDDDWGVELSSEEKVDLSSGSEGLDESRSLLSRASGSKNFPELHHRKNKNKGKQLRKSFFDIVNALTK